MFEGGEGSGKTTQAARLAASLDAVLTREPGGTRAGENIRQLLLDPTMPAVGARAETLLMLAARAEHVDQVVAPALEAGRDVVCDRFSGSTIAYQGYGRGLDPGEVGGLSRWASVGLEPDLVLFVTVPREEAARRRAARSGDGRPTDRMEEEAPSFHARIADGFAELARLDPDRWVPIDGSGTPEEVAARVMAALRRLPAPPDPGTA